MLERSKSSSVDRLTLNPVKRSLWFRCVVMAMPAFIIMFTSRRVVSLRFICCISFVSSNFISIDCFVIHPPYSSFFIWCSLSLDGIVVTLLVIAIIIVTKVIAVAGVWYIWHLALIMMFCQDHLVVLWSLLWFWFLILENENGTQAVSHRAFYFKNWIETISGTASRHLSSQFRVSYFHCSDGSICKLRSFCPLFPLAKPPCLKKMAGAATRRRQWENRLIYYIVTR